MKIDDRLEHGRKLSIERHVSEHAQMVIAPDQKAAASARLHAKTRPNGKRKNRPNGKGKDTADVKPTTNLPIETELQRAVDDAVTEFYDELDQADRNPRHDSRRVEFARQREKDARAALDEFNRNDKASA